jgi:hypothetical protein
LSAKIIPMVIATGSSGGIGRVNMSKVSRIQSPTEKYLMKVGRVVAHSITVKSIIMTRKSLIS